MRLPSRRSSPPTPASGNGYSLLDRELHVAGDLRTRGSMRIDGHLEGSVLGADTVVLGVGASMVGDVHARELIIGGELTGNSFVSERVELQATAIVTGNIATQVVLVQEGGVINGRVEMRPSTAMAAPARVPDAAASVSTSSAE